MTLPEANKQQTLILAQASAAEMVGEGEALAYHEKALTLGRMVDGETGSVTVTLTLSEAGAATITAAALGYSTIVTFYDDGMLTIQGDASEVQAMLNSLVVHIPMGRVEPLTVDVVVGAGSETNELRLVLFYEEDGNRFVSMVVPSSDGTMQHEVMHPLEGETSKHGLVEENWAEWDGGTVGVTDDGTVLSRAQGDLLGSGGSDGLSGSGGNGAGSDAGTGNDIFYTGGGGSGGGSVTPNRSPVGVDDAPIALNEGVTSANLGALVLGNDSDPDGDAIGVSAASAVTGSVSVNWGAQTFTYTASGFESLAQGQTANDTVTYTVSDGNGGTDTAQFTVTVTGVNDVPVLDNESISVNENATTANIHATVLLGDVDVDAGDSFDITSVDTTGTTGLVTFNGGTDTLTYQATAAFDYLADGESTTDSFTYTVTDSYGGVSTATVTMTINGVNDGPTATDDGGISVEAGNTTSNLHATLLSNDTDPDTSDVLDILSVDTTGTTGSVTFNGATNSLTYTASGFALAPGASTTDTFTYTVSDGNGGTDTATVTVTVNNTILNLTASITDNLAGGGLATLIQGAGGDWHSSDTVAGGGGSDTLEITSGTATANFATYTNVSGIETFELNSDAAHSITLSNAYVTSIGGAITITTTATTQGITVTGSVLTAGNAMNVTGGGAGDSITGGSGNDTLSAGNGGDTVSGLAGTDNINLGAGNDLIRGSGADLGTDTITGGTGVDTLRITGGTGSINTGTANLSSLEVIELNSNAAHSVTLTDAYVDGTESDNVTVTTTSTTGITVNASALLAGRTLSATGATGADTITGGAGDDTLVGGAGNDSLTGGAGSENIDGGADNDLIYGAGTSFTAADTVAGGTGTDTLRATTDALTLDTSTATNYSGIEVFQLNADAAHTLVIQDAYFATAGFTGSVVYVTTTATTQGINVNAISLTGGRAIHVTGGGGNDTLDGSDGSDTLLGGGGNDRVNSIEGDDSINLGIGNDLVVVATTADLTAADTIIGGTGADTLRVTGAAATIDTSSYTNLSSFDTFQLNSDAAHSLTLTDAYVDGTDSDSVTVTTTATTQGITVNAAFLAAGRTVNVTGGGAADTLTGGAGDDTINGGGGADVIAANDGADTLTGGTGNDTFQFLTTTESTTVASDRITDFAQGQDKIDLSFHAGNFDDISDLIISNNGVDTFIDDPGSSFRITLSGVYTLTNDDFIFNPPDMAAPDGTAFSYRPPDNAALTWTMTGYQYGTGDPSTWTLPGWLTLDSITGALSGTPAETADLGTLYITLTASNGVSKSFEIFVYDNEAGSVVFGTTGADNPLNGTGGADVMFGDGGADSILGDSVADTTGEDTVHGGVGNDTIRDNEAGAGDDQVFFGGQGNDYIQVRRGNDTVYGGDGNDTVSAVNGYNLIYLGKGDDQYSGSGSISTVYGGEGNDTITGATTAGYDDRMDAGSGNDLFTYNATFLDSDDTLIGGTGTDTLRITSNALAMDTATWVNLSGIESFELNSNAAHSLTLTDAYLATINGSTLTVTTTSTTGITVDGSNLTNAAYGLSVMGGTGNDTLRGSAGDDWMAGGDGGDVIYMTSANFDVDDTISGGAATDIIRFTDAVGFAINMSALTNLSGVEALEFLNAGASGYVVTVDDAYMARPGYNGTFFYVSSMASNLTVDATGLSGANYLDVLWGGPGSSNLQGGSGNDVFRFSGADLGASDTIVGGAGTDELRITVGTCTLDTSVANMSSIETISLQTDAAHSVTLTDAYVDGVASDRVTVTTNATTAGITVDASALLAGRTVSVTGGGAADTLTGGAGTDTIAGGGGGDLITGGGGGADNLTGGTGADTFDFNALSEMPLATRDVVTDFSQADVDQLDFTGLGLSYIGNNAFTSTAGEMRWYQSGGNTLIDIDSDGDGVADYGIQLTGLINLVFADFAGVTNAEPATLNFTASAVDSLVGAAAADIFVGAGADWHSSDTVTGAAGNDIIRINSGTATADFATYTNVSGVESFELNSNAAHSLTFTDAYVDSLTSDSVTVTTTSTAGITVDASALAAGRTINVTGGDGVDTLTGGAGNDTLIGGAAGDVIYAGAGNDSLEGGTGTDEFHFTAANLSAADIVVDNLGELDLLYVDSGLFSANLDIFINWSGIDYLMLSDNAQAHTLSATDTFFTNNGASTFAIFFTNNGAGVSIDGSGVLNSANNFVFYNDGASVADHNLVGGAGDDTMSLHGSFIDSNDTLMGGGGTDRLEVTNGAASINTGAFANMSDIEEFSFNFDGAHSLTLTDAYVDGTAADRVTVTTTATTQGITVDASALLVGRTVNVTGGSGGDSLLGGAGNDTIAGGLGNDTVFGLDGNDDVSLGDGNDLLIAPVSAAITPSDTISGGAGADTVRTTNGVLTIDTGTYTNISSIEVFEMNSDAAHSLTLTDAYVDGTDGDSVTVTTTATTQGITVNASALLAGRTLNVTGGGAADTLTGGAGADTLDGGNGNDLLTGGGGGADSLTGGTGADTFDFNALSEMPIASRDVVTDFSQADVDKLDFTGLGLTYISNTAFSSVAGQLRWYQSGGNTFIDIDSDGDASADYGIQLNGLITLTYADFVGVTEGGLSLMLTASAVDSLVGGGAADTFTGAGGDWHSSDTVTGGAGTDILRITSGTATADFAAYTDVSGIETFELNSNAAHSLTFTDTYVDSLTSNSVTVTTTSTSGITVDASALLAGRSINVTGGGSADTLTGGAGNDTIIGGNGGNVISGAAGNDSLVGGNDQDYFYVDWDDFDANDTLTGGLSYDELHVTAGTVTLDTDTLPNMTGIGRFFFDADAAHSVTFHDAYWDAANDGLDLNGFYIRFNGGATTGVYFDASDVLANWRGMDLGVTDGNDTVLGSDLASGTGDYITAYGGDDNLSGLRGNDRFVFEGSELDNADTVDGGEGDGDHFWFLSLANVSTAVLTNTSGVEQFDFRSDHAHVLTLDDTYYTRGDGVEGNVVTVTTTATTQGITVDASAVVTATNDVSVTGGGGADTLTGGAGDDTLAGGAGADSISGGTGNNNIDGGADNDLIYNPGTSFTSADTVVGGTGTDTLRAVTDALTLNMATATSYSGIEVFQLNSNAAHSLTFTDAYLGTLSGSTLTVTTTSTTGITVNGSGLTNAAYDLNVTGGTGNDTISLGAGDDNIASGTGNDVINAAAASLNASDTIAGGAAGTDSLHITGAINATWDGTYNISGIERFYFDTAAVHQLVLKDAFMTDNGVTEFFVLPTATATLSLDASDITGANYVRVRLTNNNDSVVGGSANSDWVELRSGTVLNAGDTVEGGAGGNDRFTYENGAAASFDSGVYTGVSGFETFTFYDNYDYSVTLDDAYYARGSGIAGAVTVTSSTTTAGVTVNAGALTGTNRVTVTGGGGADTLTGGAGDDTITGGAGADSISGGTGSDTINGGNDNDLIYGAGSSFTSADTITGGAGTDTLRATTDALNIDFTTATNYSSIEVIQLNGDFAHNVVLSAAFVDGTASDRVTITTTATTQGITVNANAANSSWLTVNVTGGGGNDVITGAWGDDTIDGGAGNDTLNGGAQDDSILGGAGDDSIDGGGSDDTIFGGDGNDTIQSGWEHDYVDGGDGNDYITTGGGEVYAVYDTLIGGAGDDTIVSGSDVGAGSDSLTGGTGADVFDYNSLSQIYIAGRDIITDFTQAESDKLDFTGLGLAYIGTAAFSNVAGEMRWYQSGGNTFIDIDSDGDGTAEYGIQLNGLITLTFADFVGVTNASGLFLTASAADSLMGAAGADTVEGQGAHWHAGDTVSGGAGADVLTIDTNAANVVLTANFSGIETIQLNADAAHSVTFVDGNFTNVTATTITVTTTATTQGITIDGTALTGTNALNVTGGGGADVIADGDAADTISGGSGNDSIVTGDGNDLVHGDAGADTIMASGTGTDTFYGDAGNDYLESNEADVLYGGDDNDTLNGGGGYWSATLYGEAGNDSLVGGTASSMYGGAGDDTIDVYLHALALGEAGNDLIIDFDGTTSIDGGADSDTIRGDAADLTTADTVSGGTGSDTLRITSGAINVDTATYTNLSGLETFELNSDAAHSLTIRNAYYSTTGFTGSVVYVTTTATTQGIFVDLIASANALNVIGGGGNDTLGGSNGSDTLIGGDGNDSLDVGAGSDSISGGAGNDTVSFGGNFLAVADTVSGGTGTDVLHMTGAVVTINTGTLVNLSSLEVFELNSDAAHSLTLTDAYVDGTEADSVTVTTTATTQGITVNASALLAGRTLNVTGGGASDTLTGGAGNDTIAGGNGADRIVFGAGSDNVDGGAGNDSIISSDGTQITAADTISGGTGNTDVLQITGGALTYNSGTQSHISGFEELNLDANAAHSVTLTDAYYATLAVTNISLNGLWSNATGILLDISAVSAPNQASLYGTMGNDTLSGGAGDDFISAVGGVDLINGGAGDDVIYANSNTWFTSSDTINGGSGNDVLYFDASGGGGAITINTGTFTNLSSVEDFDLDSNAAHNLTFTDAYVDGTESDRVTVTTSSTTGITVDASALTGTNSVSVTGGGGSDTISLGGGTDYVSGGAGDEAIYVSGANLSSADTIAGGASTGAVNWWYDGLMITDSGATINTATFTNLSGIETFFLSDGGDFANSLTLDDTYYSRNGGLSLTEVQVYNMASTAGQTVDASGVSNGANGIYFWTASSGNENISGGAGWNGYEFAGNANFTSSDTINGGSSAQDSLIINYSAGSASINTGTFTNLEGVESFDLNSTGAHSITITDGYYTTAGFSGGTVTINNNQATGITVNASAVVTAAYAINVGGGDGSGNDTLYGGAGNDTINGGAGNDSIIARGGSDSLTGGTGADTYSFWIASESPLRDIITDFSQADGDKLEMSFLSTTFIGTAAFSASFSSEMRWYQSGGNTFIDIDEDGDGVTDYGIQLNGLITLSASDFIGVPAAFSFTASTTDNLVGGDASNTYTGSAANWHSTDTVTGGTGTGDGISITSGSVNVNMATYTNISSVENFYFYGGSDIFTLTDAYVDSLTNDEVTVLVSGVSGSFIDGSALLAGRATYFRGWNNGNDTFLGGSGDDTVDLINGGNDSVSLGAGNDSIYGSTMTATDTLIGGSGTDTIRWTSGAWTYDSGTYTNLSSFEVFNCTTISAVSLTFTDAYVNALEADSVTVTLSSSGSATASTVNASALAAGRTINVTGSSKNDTLTGGAGNDTIAGGSGNDTITGNAGADLLSGDAGTDTLNGGNGDDTLEGGANGDSLIGGAGFNYLSYATSNAGVNIEYWTAGGGTASGGHAASDTISGIFQGLIGSAFNDTFSGSNNAELIWGGNGNDSVWSNDGNDTLYGEAGNDTLMGDIDNDSLNGGDGTDSLLGGNGNDTLVGGAGGDYLSGNAGTDMLSYAGSSAAVNVNMATGAASGGDATGDTINTNFEGFIGSDYNDTVIGEDSVNELFYGGLGNDSIAGNLGNDTTYGGAGNDSMYGGGGADVFYGEDGIDTIWGGTGNDTIDGGNDADELYGEDNNDTITGGAGNDSIDGMNGNDTVEGGAGADTMFGGAGTDILSYANSGAAVNVNLSADTATGGDATGDSIGTFEGVIGSAYNDTLTGNGSANSLQGGDGNDYLWGGAGVDTIDGGNGDDTVEGSAGGDNLSGGAGSNDRLDYSGSSAAVSVNLATSATSGGDAASDTISGFEGIIGSSYNDTLTGSTGNNYLYAYSGNDTVDGGDGNDTIEGGAGADNLTGGLGTDYISYDGSNAAVSVNLATNAVSGGHAASDTITGFEGVFGSSYNDTLTASASGSYMWASGGADLIVGGAGSDTFDGSSGADTLRGGGGIDYLTGGSGADIFDFNALTDSTNLNSDRIEDFENGTDRVELTGLGFTSMADFEQFGYAAGVTVLRDTDTNFTITFAGDLTAQLDNSDFIF